MHPFTVRSPLTFLIVTAITFLSGCSTHNHSHQDLLIPEYIGSKCSSDDRSRIVTPKEIYAVCLNDQWVLVNGDQFGIYKVLLDNPVKRPEIVMQKPVLASGGAQGDLCIKVSEIEVGWADVEYEGSVMRFPLVDGSCSLSPCGTSPEEYQPGICQLR